MALTRATVGGKITAAIINAIIDLAEGNTPGLKRVVPTSVAGTGVSFDNETGLVTFTATTTAGLQVNGVFTSTYRNYLVQCTVVSRSGTSFNTFKLRASGTDLSTGYDLQRTIRGGGIVAAALTNNADMPLGQGNVASNQYDINVYGPQLTGQTRMMSMTIESSAAAAPTVVDFHGSTRSTSSYDGFSMYPAAGTMTGTLKVYGYN